MRWPMRGILGLRIGGEMAPSMLLCMTWRRADSRGFEVSDEKHSVGGLCELYHAISSERSKYHVRSVILRISSEVTRMSR
jgi:hypothetical protein